MGAIREVQPVLLVLCAFSRHDDALDWARQRLVEEHGPLGLESEHYPFVETDYYHESMGGNLRKVFWAPSTLVDPGRLASIKRWTNRLEAEYAAAGGHQEPRPLNLDPGYITLGKLVLASTKDHTHRVYLCDGIYGEVTLFYKHHAWHGHAWTFPDYAQPTYHAYFDRCRDYLKKRRRETSAC